LQSNPDGSPLTSPNAPNRLKTAKQQSPRTKVRQEKVAFRFCRDVRGRGCGRRRELALNTVCPTFVRDEHPSVQQITRQCSRSSLSFGHG
jgi:hypothetical protein